MWIRVSHLVLDFLGFEWTTNYFPKENKRLIIIELTEWNAMIASYSDEE